VLLFESENADKRLLFVGPGQWEPMGGLLHEYGISMEDKKGTAMSLPGDDETHYKLFQLGWILIRGVWYRPLFIPPSQSKVVYTHWYFRSVRRQIHQQLPSTGRILVAGYSFPDADIEHLGAIFVRGVLHPEVEVAVVNPSNGQPAFRDRVSRIFGAVDIDYSVTDFKQLGALISRFGAGGRT
jgi:hypothetical protein